VPGLYINDGGATSSALGQILGGIATNMGPEAAAKAEYQRYLTEHQDIESQKAAEALQTLQNATNLGGAALRQAGAQPGVADTVAGYATPPPLVGAYRHPSGVTLSNNPYTAQVQNWIQTGQATPEAWRGSILPTGQEMVGGPGSSTSTQTEIAKANMMPHDLPLGMTRTTPRPDLGAAPPGVVPRVESGGSPIEQDVQGATAKEAMADQKAGSQAADAMAQLAALQELRRTVVKEGHFEPGDVVFDEAAKKADAVFGTGAFTRLNGRLDVLAAIRGRMKMITAATRLAFAGDPSMRGLAQTLDDSLPDVESDQFDNGVEAIKKTLGVTLDDANAAAPLVNQPADPGLARQFREGKLARHAAAAAAADEALKASRVGSPAAAEGGGPPPPDGGGGQPRAPVAAPGGKRWRFNPETGRAEPL
jgi:hypothetical protein